MVIGGGRGNWVGQGDRILALGSLDTGMKEAICSSSLGVQGCEWCLEDGYLNIE